MFLRCIKARFLLIGHSPVVAYAMARLHEDSDSGEEFPDLWTIMYPATQDQRKIIQSNEVESTAISKAVKKERKIINTLKKERRGLQDEGNSSHCATSVTKVSFAEKQVRKQKPLGLAHVNSLLLPISNISLHTPEKLQKPVTHDEDKGVARTSPKRRAKTEVEHKMIIPDFYDAAQSTEDEESHDSLSDFIVYDSISESETEPPRSIYKGRGRSPKKNQQDHNTHQPSGTNIKQNVSKPKAEPAVIDLVSPAKNILPTSSISLQARRSDTPTEVPELGDPYTEDPCANLRLYVIFL